MGMRFQRVKKKNNQKSTSSATFLLSFQQTTELKCFKNYSAVKTALSTPIVNAK